VDDRIAAHQAVAEPGCPTDEQHDRNDFDDFAVIPVGKDGTVKLRKDRPVAPKDIFRLIDSMPMRQREMKR